MRCSRWRWPGCRPRSMSGPGRTGWPTRPGPSPPVQNPADPAECPAGYLPDFLAGTEPGDAGLRPTDTARAVQARSGSAGPGRAAPRSGPPGPAPIIGDAGREAEMATRTRLPGALSWALLAVAVVGVMAVVAACGSVRA